MDNDRDASNRATYSIDRSKCIHNARRAHKQNEMVDGCLCLDICSRICVCVCHVEMANRKARRLMGCAIRLQHIHRNEQAMHMNLMIIHGGIRMLNRRYGTYIALKHPSNHGELQRCQGL